MNPVREAIYGVLSGDAELQSLLSEPDAIHHRRAPKGAQTPYVIFFRMPGTSESAMKGPLLRSALWVVKGVVRGYDATPAEDIDARAEELLHNAKLQLSRGTALDCARESDVEYGEDDQDAVIHHVGGLYRVWSE